MNKVGLILVLVVVTVTAWAGWTYATTEDTLLDIGSRLPAEEALNAMPFEETVEQLKLAMIQCDRLSWLEVNPLARLLRGDEIKSLAEHCELIKSRQESLQGP